MRQRLTVVYEDNHLLAVAKPAGVPTMGAPRGEPTVLEMAREDIRDRYDKPGNVYLGVVSRLDAPVTGLLLLARTSKAAGRLTEAFRTRRVQKRYLATVEGEPADGSASLVHHLKKDDRNHRMFATHADAPGAQHAELDYEVLLRERGRSLLLVRPKTGRKHQIRVQLAKIGVPIRGDHKYGAPSSLDDGSIGLHSWRLDLEHPVRRELLFLRCDPRPGWCGWPAEALSDAVSSASKLPPPAGGAY